jgi:hypothetical protein
MCLALIRVHDNAVVDTLDLEDERAGGRSAPKSRRYSEHAAILAVVLVAFVVGCASMLIPRGLPHSADDTMATIFMGIRDIRHYIALRNCRGDLRPGGNRRENRTQRSGPAEADRLGRLLDPELVHSGKRVRIVGLKRCPVAQLSAVRIVGKAHAILMQDAATQFETDELKAEIGKE